MEQENVQVTFGELPSEINGGQDDKNKDISEQKDEDAYAKSVERLFESYKRFQTSMQDLTKLSLNPGLLLIKLPVVLDDFKHEIEVFRSGDYQVAEVYAEGHAFIEAGLEKYDEFLVEYPLAMKGKKKLKAMKRIHELGALSGRADKDLKAAFYSFSRAIEESEEGARQ